MDFTGIWKKQLFSALTSLIRSCFYVDEAFRASSLDDLGNQSFTAYLLVEP